MSQRLFAFAGGDVGPWRVVGINTVRGQPLAGVKRVDVLGDAATHSDGASWVLRGITSNQRYATHDENARLVARQQGLGRPDSTHAALIPIRKSSAWWALAQDDRRRIFENQSAHTETGLKYLPAIARRLHHCRDLGPDEPFDFLTWFEFAPADTDAFEKLVLELRATEEWRYVEREVDIRLVRDSV